MLVEIHLRRATIGDIDRLIVICKETINAGYRPFLGDRAVDELISSGAIEAVFAERLDRCWLIEANQRIAGFAVSQRNVIDLMMVDHDLHGFGLGSRLLRHVEELLFREFDELVVESFESNEQATRFYRKNGWKEARTFRDSCTGVDKVVFRKTGRKAA